MDQKSWVWKKRSAEKSLIAATNSPRKFEGEEALEIQKLASEKIDLERELEMLNEKLSCALCECDNKDDTAKKQVKLAEEAIAGWEKAESKVLSLKQELDKALKQKSAFEERTVLLDAALKECMHQSRLIREEHAKRAHDTVFKTSEELKETKKSVDEKLSENAQLIKALSIKEKTIADLIRYKIQADADFKTLRSRVESTGKENASLKYGSRLLEKELEIRNEERELNRREADGARKQHGESLKRIEKLEMECQRLRLLVKKRLWGHSDLGRVKRDIGLLGTKDRNDVGRKKSNLSPSSSTESSKGQRNLSRAFSDEGIEDKASCAESLVSEFDHLKNENTPSHGNLITPDINHLMDDFAEMEKLVETPSNLKNGGCNNTIPIRKILELVEGINVNKAQDKGYTVRVFQWKSAELSAILERFVLNCHDLLSNGTYDFGYFAREIASSLEWVVNHCFSIQDVRWGVSDWDEWRSECEEDLSMKERILREEVEGRNGDDELRKAWLKISDLEKELEDKDNSRKRLEETCHDLMMQLKSKEAADDGRQQLESDWEMTAASEKLVECQETILNLGKQLKELASPSNEVHLVPRSSTSLLGKMMAEEDSGNEEMLSNGKGVIKTSDVSVKDIDIGHHKKIEGKGFFNKLFRRKGYRNTLLIGCS